MTKVAITIIKHAILTCLGIRFLKSEIKILEKTRTKITASPIPTALSKLLVTASVGHSPRTSLKGGISAHNPFVNSCITLLAIDIFPC
jgi:hypothetical protein